MNISPEFCLSSDISQALDSIENDVQSWDIYKILEALDLVESVQKQVESIITNEDGKKDFLQRIKTINTEISRILKISAKEIGKQIIILEKEEAQSVKILTQKIIVPQIWDSVPPQIVLSPPQKISYIPVIDKVLWEQITQFFRDYPGISYSLHDLQKIFWKDASKTKEEVQNAFLFARAQLNKNGKNQLQTENGSYRYISKEKPKGRKILRKNSSEQKVVKAVKIKTPKDTRILIFEAEKIDSFFWEFHIKTVSVSYIGKNKKEFIVQVWNEKISLSQGEYNLFRKFITQEENILLIAEQYSYYKNIKEQLTNTGTLKLIPIFEQKRRKRELGEKIVKEKIVKEKIIKLKVPKNNEIILSEDKKINVQLGDFSIQTEKSEGRGKKQIFFVKINEKVLEFTPSPYELFKILCETKEVLELVKNRIPTLRIVKKLLTESGFWELANLLSERRKMKEKIEKQKENSRDNNISQVNTFWWARIPYQKPVLKPDPLSSSTYSQVSSSLSKSNIEVDEVFNTVIKNFLLENPGKTFSFMELYEKFAPDSWKSFDQIRTALLLLKAQEEKKWTILLKITHGMIGYFPKIVVEDTEKTLWKTSKGQREGIYWKEKIPSQNKDSKEKIRQEPKEILLRDVDPREQIESYVFGMKYTTLWKTLHWSVTRYKIHIWDIVSQRTEILLTESEFKILFLLLQKKGKILKILPKYLPALRTLSKKLPENHIRNERGEGYFIGEYSPDIIQTNRRVAQIDNPLEKKDYTFETDNELQSTIIKIFKEHKGDFFTLEALWNTLAIPKEERVKVRTQFLLAKSNYNNGKIQIIETPYGWTHIPDIFDSRFLFLWDLEVHYEEKYGALFSKNGDMIFQSKEIQKYLFIKKWRIYTKKSKMGSERIHLVDFFSTLNRKYPHLIIEKDGSITARGEHEAKQKEKLRIANQSPRNLLAPPSK